MRGHLWLLVSLLLAFGAVAGSVSVLVHCSQTDLVSVGVVSVVLFRGWVEGKLRQVLSAIFEHDRAYQQNPPRLRTGLCAPVRLHLGERHALMGLPDRHLGTRVLHFILSDIGAGTGQRPRGCNGHGLFSPAHITSLAILLHF